MDINETLQNILIILTRQEEHLKEHMRRTELNEERIEQVEEKWDRIESHLDKIEGAFTLLKWGGGSLTIILVILQILKHATNL